jgi:hypothetical protein
MRRVRACGLVVTLLAPVYAQDAAEIMRRSAEQVQTSSERLRNYTFLQRAVEVSYNKAGEETKRESETHEILILAGRPYERLVAKNGEPLSEKDARKEQEKVDKELAKRLKDPEKQRKELEKEREEDRRFLAEVLRAFDFTLLGEETLEGVPVWKLHAVPREAFKPKEDRAKILQRMRGDIWVEQDGYQWVKMDLEVIETISLGWFLVRIPPGAKILFAQTRLNDELWGPAEFRVRAEAKVGLLKTFRMGLELDFSEYRRFSAESQVIGVEEVPATGGLN